MRYVIFMRKLYEICDFYEQIIRTMFFTRKVYEKCVFDGESI